MKKTIAAHALFWAFSILLLSWIYGVAYGSFMLGIVVILMLIPVHMVYFYSITKWVVPKLFLRQRYWQTFFVCLSIALAIAILYRLDEMYCSDQFILNWFKAKTPGFVFTKLSGSFTEQLFRPLDFVNAIERSNVIVWIGISLWFIQLWYERQQAALQAELNFLKGQIHPHFLFNTLNNLYALSLNESKQAPPVILGLSHILRYMLYECNAETVLLKRDIEILQSYIALEKIRYEDRLDLNFNITGNANIQTIAPLLMLPLVENAFKHGVSETIDAPWINIELQIDQDSILLKVSNSKPETKTTGDKSSATVGITNVKKRLNLLYPDRHKLELLDEDDVYIAILQLELTKPAQIS